MYKRDHSFMKDVPSREAQQVFGFDHVGQPDEVQARTNQRQLEKELQGHPYAKYSTYRCQYGGKDGLGRPFASHLEELESKVIHDLLEFAYREFPDNPPVQSPFIMQRRLHHVRELDLAGGFVGRTELLEYLHNYLVSVWPAYVVQWCCGGVQ